VTCLHAGFRLLTGLSSWLQASNGRYCSTLSTYGSATLILNFTIHLFLSVRSTNTLTQHSHACLDCQHHHRHRRISLAGHEAGLSSARFGHHAHDHGYFQDARQPFMHSREDVDSRESSEYQTSGFNSPRQSAETLATTDKGDIADCLA